MHKRPHEVFVASLAQEEIWSDFRNVDLVLRHGEIRPKLHGVLLSLGRFRIVLLAQLLSKHIVVLELCDEVKAEALVHFPLLIRRTSVKPLKHADHLQRAPHFSVLVKHSLHSLFAVVDEAVFCILLNLEGSLRFDCELVGEKMERLVRMHDFTVEQLPNNDFVIPPHGCQPPHEWVPLLICRNVKVFMLRLFTFLVFL